MAELSHSTGFNLSQYESDSIFIMCFITFVTLSSVQCCSASSSLLYIHIWIIYSWKTCTTIWKYFCCTISDLVAFFYMLYLWWMWHMKLVITCTSSRDTTCLCVTTFCYRTETWFMPQHDSDCVYLEKKPTWLETPDFTWTCQRFLLKTFILISD